MSAITTGATGRISDTNLAESATLSGGAWLAGLPRDNLKDRSFVGRPARCVTPGVAGAATVIATLSRVRAVKLVALLFHTISMAGRWRITFHAPPQSAPVWQTEWMPVWQRWASSAAIAWEDSHWWTGQAPDSVASLYPAHAVWALPTLVAAPLASVVTVEIDDPTNAAGFLDVGGLWIGDAFGPVWNFDRGRVLGIDARDLVEEGPSGRIFGQARTPRRSLELKWSGLDDAEARRLFDAGARVRGDAAMLIVPDADDASGLARECWPAVWVNRPQPTFNFSGTNEVSASIKEIIA